MIRFLPFLTCLAFSLTFVTSVFPIDSSYGKLSEPQVQRTLGILLALDKEDNHEFKKALEIWKRLPARNESISEHIRYNELVLGMPGSLGSQYGQEKSILWQINYLKWKKKWQSALNIIDKYQKTAMLTTGLMVEKITLLLYLGTYDKAGDLIVALKKKGDTNSYRALIFKCWLDSLTGETNNAVTCWNEMDSGYLYIPIVNVVPGFPDSAVSLDSAIEQSLLRYPAMEDVLDLFISVLLNKRDWQALDRLLDKDLAFAGNSVYWPLFAEVLIHTSQTARLERLLKFVAKSEMPTHEFYEVAARSALKQSKWETLKIISESYIRKYPEILDGRLFLAAYFEGIGNLQKSRSIIKAAGLVD